VIDPPYLATLRRQLRAELTMSLVQIEQLGPGWWPTLSDLAEQLGTERATLNRCIAKLERQGLLRRVTRGNSGGTWIWWVKRSADDLPDDSSAPRWVLKDMVCNCRREIIVGQERAFAEAKGIPYHTVRNFLAGHRPLLAKRWKLISSPLQIDDGSENGPRAA
jgi:hypothetical protein